MQLQTVTGDIDALCVAGLFAASASAVHVSDKDPTDVKADPKPAETSQSRAVDPNQKEEMIEAKDTSRQGTNAKTDAAFMKADKDSDGTLDRREVKRMLHVARNFDAIDDDNDGTVTLHEVQSHMAAHPGK